MKNVAVIGARGYVGRELLRLLDGHAGFAISAVSSRALAGQHLREAFELQGDSARLVVENLTPAMLADRDIDVCVLALPNNLAAPYVQALDAHPRAPVVIDLSADYRFNSQWYYGLPELTRAQYNGQRHISNPGCYATGAQLAIAPVRDQLSGPANIFGVSGYSGAGTSPSRRNDPDALADNLMPYALTGHIHEREIAHQLGAPVHFSPHVASFFRGISLTVMLALRTPTDATALQARYQQRYAQDPLIRIQTQAPEVKQSAHTPGACLGGFSVSADGHHGVVVATLDNLLKGAATQALQNMNLAFAYPELDGIAHA